MFFPLLFVKMIIPYCVCLFLGLTQTSYLILPRPNPVNFDQHLWRLEIPRIAT
uniref:Uncharacterized protein n=1 Tax=Arundo donax TaxID=35708 RepID=A0A0A9I392_ARUDO